MEIGLKPVGDIVAVFFARCGNRGVGGHADAEHCEAIGVHAEIFARRHGKRQYIRLDLCHDNFTPHAMGRL